MNQLKGHERSCSRVEIQVPARSEGSSPAQLRAPSCTESLGQAPLQHLNLSVLSTKIPENKVYKDSSWNKAERSWLPETETGWIPCSWTGCYWQSPICVQGFGLRTALWRLEKDLIWTLKTLLGISPDRGLGSEPFHLCPSYEKELVFCVIVKSRLFTYLIILSWSDKSVDGSAPWKESLVYRFKTNYKKHVDLCIVLAKKLVQIFP